MEELIERLSERFRKYLKEPDDEDTLDLLRDILETSFMKGVLHERNRVTRIAGQVDLSLDKLIKILK